VGLSTAGELQRLLAAQAAAFDQVSAFALDGNRGSDDFGDREGAGETHVRISLLQVNESAAPDAGRTRSRILRKTGSAPAFTQVAAKTVQGIFFTRHVCYSTHF